MTMLGTSIRPTDVRRRLLTSYPARLLGWVGDASWGLDMNLPLAKLQMERRPAPRDPTKVSALRKAISGDRTKELPPIVVVKTPSGDHRIADGYHRALAYRQAGRSKIPAFVGEVDNEDGPWRKSMHLASRNMNLAGPGDIAALLDLVGPKGYVHGWKRVYGDVGEVAKAKTDSAAREFEAKQADRAKALSEQDDWSAANARLEDARKAATPLAKQIAAGKRGSRRGYSGLGRGLGPLPDRNYGPGTYDKITDDVYLGGAINSEAMLKDLQSKGITNIVNMQFERDDRPLVAGRMGVKWVPIGDDGIPKGRETWLQVADYVRREKKKNPKAKFYFHCAAGINRGPSGAFAGLIALGYKPARAKQLIQTSRPITKRGLAYAPDVERYAQLLRMRPGQRRKAAGRRIPPRSKSEAANRFGMAAPPASALDLVGPKGYVHGWKRISGFDPDVRRRHLAQFPAYNARLVHAHLPTGANRVHLAKVHGITDVDPTETGAVHYDEHMKSELPQVVGLGPGDLAAFAVDLAGHHIPGTPFRFRHGWIRLDGGDPAKQEAARRGLRQHVLQRHLAEMHGVKGGLLHGGFTRVGAAHEKMHDAGKFAPGEGHGREFVKVAGLRARRNAFRTGGPRHVDPDHARFAHGMAPGLSQAKMDEVHAQDHLVGRARHDEVRGNFESLVPHYRTDQDALVKHMHNEHGIRGGILHAPGKLLEKHRADHAAAVVGVPPGVGRRGGQFVAHTHGGHAAIAGRGRAQQAKAADIVARDKKAAGEVLSNRADAVGHIRRVKERIGDSVDRIHVQRHQAAGGLDPAVKHLRDRHGLDIPDMADAELAHAREHNVPQSVVRSAVADAIGARKAPARGPSLAAENVRAAHLGAFVGSAGQSGMAGKGRARAHVHALKAAALARDHLRDVHNRPGQLAVGAVEEHAKEHGVPVPFTRPAHARIIGAASVRQAHIDAFGPAGARGHIAGFNPLDARAHVADVHRLPADGQNALAIHAREHGLPVPIADVIGHLNAHRNPAAARAHLMQNHGLTAGAINNKVATDVHAQEHGQLDAAKVQKVAESPPKRPRRVRRLGNMVDSAAEGDRLEHLRVFRQAGNRAKQRHKAKQGAIAAEHLRIGHNRNVVPDRAEAEHQKEHRLRNIVPGAGAHSGPRRPGAPAPGPDKNRDHVAKVDRRGPGGAQVHVRRHLAAADAGDHLARVHGIHVGNRDALAKHAEVHGQPVPHVPTPPKKATAAVGARNDVPSGLAGRSVGEKSALNGRTISATDVANGTDGQKEWEDKVAAAVAGGEVKRSVPEKGGIDATEFVTFADGTKLMERKFDGWFGAEGTRNEKIANDLARAAGVHMARIVIRKNPVGRKVAYQEILPGVRPYGFKTKEPNGAPIYANMKQQAELRKIAAFDYLVGNADRVPNMGHNLMAHKLPDGHEFPVAIDMSAATLSPGWNGRWGGDQKRLIDQITPEERAQFVDAVFAMKDRIKAENGSFDRMLRAAEQLGT